MTLDQPRYSPDELARLLGVTRRTVYRWLDGRRITYIKPAGRVVILRDDVQRLVNRRTFKQRRTA